MPHNRRADDLETRNPRRGRVTYRPGGQGRSSMQGVVEAAATDRLGEIAVAVWKAYAAGGLSDEQAQTLDGLLNARRAQLDQFLQRSSPSRS